MNEGTRKGIIVRDGGGWFIALLFGGPALFIGIGFDYLWNYLVISKSLNKITENTVSSRRMHLYCIIATGLGLTIDWVYYQWLSSYLNLEQYWANPILWRKENAGPISLLLTIVLPILAIALANFGLCIPVFHLNIKKAALVGVAMGGLTAPWLIVGWVLMQYYVRF